MSGPKKGRVTTKSSESRVLVFACISHVTLQLKVSFLLTASVSELRVLVVLIISRTPTTFSVRPTSPDEGLE
jgi:hypothetical protein